jgi:tRNA pseudouridine38-40 synthase
MPRVAVRVAYDGRAFRGSQRQPDVRTVEGELLAALAKLGALDAPEAARFQCASRTDKGVSAAGNVVAFDTGFRLDALLPALGAGVEDAWPYALAEVPADFEARRARSRRYVYFLPGAGLEVARLDEALQRFVGTHDFRSFARLEPGVDPVRRVTRIAARPQGAWLAIEVEGESFLWNQVRRIVEASRRVAAGEAPLEDIDRGLRGERVELGTAAAEGLVLASVEHRVAWRAHEAARRAALEQLGQRLAAVERGQRVLGELRAAVEDSG